MPGNVYARRAVVLLEAGGPEGHLQQPVDDDRAGLEPAPDGRVEARPGQRSAASARVQQERMEKTTGELGQGGPDVAADQFVDPAPQQARPGRVDVADRPVRIEEGEPV